MIKSRIERVCDVSITGYSYVVWHNAPTIWHRISASFGADKFTNKSSKPGAWVFTSATLAVSDDFDHFTSRPGLRPSAQFSLPGHLIIRIRHACVPRYLQSQIVRLGWQIRSECWLLWLSKTKIVVSSCGYLTQHDGERLGGRQFRETLAVPFYCKVGPVNKTLAEFMGASFFFYPAK